MTQLGVVVDLVGGSLFGASTGWILARYAEARRTSRRRLALERDLRDPNAAEEP